MSSSPPRASARRFGALKIAVPLVLLLAVVFGVTYLARYTPVEEGGTTTKTEATATGTGLEFFTATRHWDPATFTQIFEPESKVSLQDVAFPGFFEPGETTHATHFWFRTRNPGKLTLRLGRVSCTQCSGGRVAPIPPEAVRALLQMSAVSALPVGPVGACPPGMAGAGAFLAAKLQWQAHSFAADPATVVFEIPPAADTDGWSPGWGILELNFKVRPNPNTPLRALFGTFDETDALLHPDQFTIDFAAAQGVEVDKSAIDAGELADNTPAQVHALTVYSATRAADDLPDLAAHVVNPGGGDPGPFVAVGKAERLTADEITRLAARLAAGGKAVRVKAAFRVPVTVAAKVGTARADIGRLDREVWVTAAVPGMEPKKVAVKAAVTGAVTLAGGGADINLGSFKTAAGTAETVVVTTDPAGVPLELVAGATRPDFLEVGLRQLPDAGGRGQWQLTTRVPPGRHRGEITDGLVVLELKGPAPQRIRLPVRGRGLQ